MAPSMSAYGSAIGLLLLLVGLAWGLQWLKKKQMADTGEGHGALRLVSQLAVGPQQRVVVVEVQTPQGPTQLTLGVTSAQVSLLHTAPKETA